MWRKREDPMQSYDTKKQPKHTGQADNLAFFGKQEGQKGQRWTVVHPIVICQPVIPVLNIMSVYSR